MRILVAGFGHETNTFSVERCDFNRFAPNGWILGNDVIETSRNTETYLGGMISAAEASGVDLVPVISCSNAGPLITKETLETICGKLLEGVAKNRDSIDGICLSVHGAGCAETTDDLETYTLEKIRELTGPEMPITVTLDLHGNISKNNVRLANGLFGIKEYPHTDCAAAGDRAMKALINIIKTGHRPYTALVQMPLFIPPAMASTFNGPLKTVKDLTAAAKERMDLIDATFFHGFPYQDAPHCRASVVTVAESAAKAEEAALDTASSIWEMREAFHARSLSAEEAVEQALEEAGTKEKGYVVINETSDNPGGGAPCNGTHLLRTLVERGVKGSILGFIHDPEIALVATEAGTGGRISGLLGGKTDTLHGTPMELRDAEVLGTAKGILKIISPMWRGLQMDFGKIARIRIGVVEVVVAEKLAYQPLDDQLFTLTGADMEKYRIVGLKSSNHFRAYFETRAKAIVTADPPGVHTGNFSQLNYRNIQRPVFPLDRITVFTPSVFSSP